MPDAPDVAVIIVGLNARDFVRGCVESLLAAPWRQRRFEIIYVDNGSRDDTIAMLTSGFPQVRIIANPTNLGFCKAANQGGRASQARYFYFINDDTLLVDDAIAMLVDYMDCTPDAGTVGSRLLYPDGTEQWSGRRFPSMMNAIFGRRTFLTKFFPNAPLVRNYLCKDELQGTAPFEVDWVSAAGQIVRPDAFFAVGGFAEDYYYWHEAVFCDRIRRHGQRVLLHPLSKIIHYEGKGSGARPYKTQKFHILDFHRGAYRCYCEHHRLGAFHPLRWITAAALASRAAVLLAISRVRTLQPGKSAAPRPPQTGTAGV
jgi:N-acetylglucosaminyl-diphospho-decaprenol L-rhamnosyltransferase